MEIIKVYTKSAEIHLSLEELIIINNALNEVSNALDQFEFQTRMGAEHLEVEQLLNQVNNLINQMENKSE